jgi:hypothetical protein
MGKLTGVTRRKIAGKQFTMSTAQVVDVVLDSDDDGVVDGVDKDEAKMMDTISSTGKTQRADGTATASGGAANDDVKTHNDVIEIGSD